MKSTPIFFILLFFLSCMSQVTSDIYLPAMPTIQHTMHTTTHLVQLSLALFMLGFSLSQLVYGPISDSVGRKKPLIVGILIAIIGALICQFATDIQFFIAGRIIQGLGVGASATLYLTILRDLYSGNKLAKIGSFLNVSRVFLLAASPLIGSYILRYFGWRACFTFLIIYAGFCLVGSLITLKETNQFMHLHKHHFINVFKNYWVLLTHPIFMGYSFCTMLTFGGILAWLTSLPFILQNVVGLTPVEFGWVSAIAGLFFAVGGFINAMVVERLGLNHMLKVGLVIMFSGGMIMLGFGLYGTINTAVIMIPVVIYIIGSSMIFSNAYAGAFHPFPKMAGTAGALFGFLQVLGGSISSTLMSYARTYDQIPLSIVLIMTAAISFAIVVLLSRTKLRSVA